jgi:CBS domain containing-hemolysin-like protein
MYNSANMFALLVIITVTVFVCLVLIAGMRPSQSVMSAFELKRRVSVGDAVAQSLQRRDHLFVDVISTQRVVVALLLVAFVLLSVATFGWLLGVLIGVIGTLEYGALSRFSVTRTWSTRLYTRMEPHLLNLIEKSPTVFLFLRSTPPSEPNPPRIDSREELQYLIAHSNNALNADEKKLIGSGLSFGAQLVSSVMTPRSVIDSIKSSEFLGPLILDELHKQGHSRLPVIDQDIDHVVGILHLRSLLTLDIKRSVTAGKAMDPHVFYIRQDQTLQHALAAFLRTHHHLFVVVNEFRETVGLLSLEDVIEALLGRAIVDEFDAHDDLRRVALRNPRENNAPEKQHNI